MGRKEKEEVDENPNSYPPKRSVDYTQSRPSAAEVATPRSLQVVESPSPPQRRRSSSVAKQMMTEEGDIGIPKCVALTNLIYDTFYYYSTRVHLLSLLY